MRSGCGNCRAAPTTTGSLRDLKRHVCEATIKPTLRRPLELSLYATIRVVHELTGVGRGVQCLLERIERQVGPQRPGHTPADDESCERVDHEGHVHEPAPRGDVGQVRDPQRVGPPRRNVRFTRSAGRSAASLVIVVLNRRPRTAPCRPICRISRATVQRATATPSRLS